MPSLWQLNLRIRWYLFLGAVLLFILVLPIYACSGCEIRKRNEKRACREGKVDACLVVARYYEAKADGLFGFLLSNAITSNDAYARACKLGSAEACERAAYVILHYDAARDTSYSYADAARDFATACVAGVANACDELYELYDDPRGNSLAEDVSSRLFLDRCRKENDGAACYRFGVFMKAPHAHGEIKPDPALEQAMYKEGCTKGYQPACDAVTSDAGASP